MNNTEFVERFKREAEAAGRLRHPNVINVTDFGFATVDERQMAYLVMEYLDGFTLGEMLKNGQRFPLWFVVDTVEQVCLAIDKAHQQGIIHRDLKPDNIWLEANGRGGYNIKVLDFGIAKLRVTAPIALSEEASPTEKEILPAAAISTGKAIHQAAPERISSRSATIKVKAPAHDIADDTTQASTLITNNSDSEASTLITSSEKKAATDSQHNDAVSANDHLTGEGAVLGTPRYMSPEQCRGETIDLRSDLYSLGIIIYQMLTGEPPFQGKMFEVIKMHIKDEPLQLKEKRPDIPASVNALVMSALAKDPAARPPNAIAFATSLRANANGEKELLRQAITLYSENFGQFIKISLIGYTPMIAGVILLVMGMLIPFLHHPIAITVIMIFFFMGQFINNVVTGGVLVPLVHHLQVSPLQPFDFGMVNDRLSLRARAFLTTTLRAHISFSLSVAIPLILTAILPYSFNSWSYWLSMFAFMLFTVMLVKRDFDTCKWLYAPVSIWEEHAGKAALNRSKMLVGRLEGTLGWSFPLFVIIMVTMAILAVLLSITLVNHYEQGIKAVESVLEIFTTLSGIILNLILCMLLSPLIGIGFALFYLKAREAGGEKFE